MTEEKKSSATVTKNLNNDVEQLYKKYRSFKLNPLDQTTEFFQIIEPYNQLVDQLNSSSEDISLLIPKMQSMDFTQADLSPADLQLWQDRSKIKSELNLSALSKKTPSPPPFLSSRTSAQPVQIPQSLEKKTPEAPDRDTAPIHHHKPRSPAFWTSSKRKLAFAGLVMAMSTPLIYFEATDPNIRANTFDFITNNPLLCTVLFALTILALRATYKQYIPIPEPSKKNRRGQHSQRCNKYKAPLAEVIGIGAVATLLVFEFINPYLQAKTLELMSNDAPLLIGFTILAFLLSQKDKTPKDSDLQTPPALEEAQSRDNKEQSHPQQKNVIVEQLPWFMAAGTIITTQLIYAYPQKSLELYNQAMGYMDAHTLEIFIPSIVVAGIAFIGLVAWGAYAGYNNYQHEKKLEQQNKAKGYNPWAK